VRFKRWGHKEEPVSVVMDVVPRKGDLLLWEYTHPSASPIPVGNYVVTSVCWVMANTQYVTVLLVLNN
jgi:hypothetical protein